MQVTKERAEEVEAAWEKASRTERLRLPRVEWYAWGDGDTQYFEMKPSVMETAAAERIEELEVALRAALSFIQGRHTDHSDGHAQMVIAAVRGALRKDRD